jgi:hypothetical protein
MTGRYQERESQLTVSGLTGIGWTDPGKGTLTGPDDSGVTPNQDGDTDPVSQHRASRVKTYRRFTVPTCMTASRKPRTASDRKY